jgi:hypothetical protein
MMAAIWAIACGEICHVPCWAAGMPSARVVAGGNADVVTGTGAAGTGRRPDATVELAHEPANTPNIRRATARTIRFSIVTRGEFAGEDGNILCSPAS